MKDGGSGKEKETGKLKVTQECGVASRPAAELVPETKIELPAC